MVKIEQSLINEVCNNLDIVDVISNYIDLAPRGNNYFGLCPFHEEKTPSFVVSKEKQIFHCFGCEPPITGNVISFIMKKEEIGFLEALKKCSEISGIDIGLSNYKAVKKENIFFKIYDDALKLYQNSIFTVEGRSARDYLLNRGIDEDTIKKFGIGLAINRKDVLTKYLINKSYKYKDLLKSGLVSENNGFYDMYRNRIMIPIEDDNGQVVGFSARQLIQDKSQGKYINSPEINGGVFHKSNILYNYYNAKDEARRTKFIYLVEGFMDAIAVDRAGFSNVVALMGTALTKEHINLLRYLNCEIRLCLDNDEPGQDAMIKISKQLDANGIKYRLVSNSQLINGKDSDEILKNGGSEALKLYLSNLITEGEFILNFHSKRLDLSNITNKKILLKEFIPFLAQLNDQIDIELYSRKLSQLSGFSLEIIQSQINAYKTKYDEQDNIDFVNDAPHFRKKNKELTRLELSERQIVRYMLENKEAVKQYDLKLGYLVNDEYREIANLIGEYIETINPNNYSVSTIIDYINGYNDGMDDATKDKIIDSITTISMTEFRYPPFSIQTFDDCVKIINDKKEWQRSYEAYSQGSIGKTEEEKAQQAKTLLDKRRDLIIQREKGNK